MYERLKTDLCGMAYHEINSDDGHDAFLSDVSETSRVLRKILEPEGMQVPNHFFANRQSSAFAQGCYK